MHNAITSRHTRSASELFLMVPIKPGFVPISDVVMTYATRVSTVLSALFELRKRKTEQGFDTPKGPIEFLQSINRVQWTVLERHDSMLDLPDGRSAFVGAQLKGPQLVLTSHFTGSWEHYFYDLASTGGPLLDLIFSHCVGYEGHSCDFGRGYERFSDFIRRHQRPCNFQYAAEPEITVDDLRYFKTVLPTLSPTADRAATAQIASVRDEADLIQQSVIEPEGQPRAPHFPHRPRDEWRGSQRMEDWTQNIVRAVQALYDIHERFFSEAPELIRFEDGQRKECSGIQLYDEAIYSVLSHEPDVARLSFFRTKVEQWALAHDVKLPPARPSSVWLKQVLEEGKKQEIERKARAALQRPDVPAGQVQGNILDNSPTAAAGAILLLRCANREALGALVTAMAEDEERLWAKEAYSGKGWYINFALTYSGLKRAELGDAVLQQFPREFAEGMEERAGSLGDVGPFNHPRFWKRPPRDPSGAADGFDLERIHLSAIDAVVVLHAQDDSTRDEAVATLTGGLLRSAEILHRTNLHHGRLDPFELTDHVSQPKPWFRGADEKPSIHNTALGEFLLGYPDRNGRIAECASEERNQLSFALFKNSTFLVIRRMPQNQKVFRDYVNLVTEQLNVAREEAVSFIVGRKPDGELRLSIPAKGTDLKNEFTAKDDPNGARCPLHTHIRLSNPRTEGTPRILRRGLAYGPDLRERPDDKADGEVGSMFMAYNSSIAEQYEILQRYINGANPNGVSSSQNDLLCGAPGPRNVPRWVSKSGDGNDFQRMPERTSSLPFVSLAWGLYTFVPSQAALVWLVGQLENAPVQPSAQERVVRGQQRIQELDAMPRDLARDEWKRLLEEVPEADSPQAKHAADVWAAIQSSSGGVKRVGEHLVIVTDAGNAQTVLADRGKYFSVAEYRRRMRSNIGDHYLAHDVESDEQPTYEALSRIPNEQLAVVTLDAFQQAFAECSKILDQPAELDQESPTLEIRKWLPANTFKSGPRRSIALRDLARAVVGGLCKTWFKMPDHGEPPAGAQPQSYTHTIATLETYLLASRYTFQFDPGKQLIEEAEEKGRELPELYAELPACPFARRLQNYAPPGGDVQRLKRQALSGAIVGFAPPTVGAVLRVIDQWIENEDFWRLASEMAALVQVARTTAAQPAVDDNDGNLAEVRGNVQGARTARAPLNQAIYTALAKTPSPPILYRTALHNSRLGQVEIVEGDQVVIALNAVYADAKQRKADANQQNLPQPEVWLFGGEHGIPGDGTNNPPHGCPVRAAGTDVIAGIAIALFARKNLKRERRGVISYDASDV